MSDGAVVQAIHPLTMRPQSPGSDWPIPFTILLPIQRIEATPEETGRSAGLVSDNIAGHL